MVISKPPHSKQRWRRITQKNRTQNPINPGNSLCGSSVQLLWIRKKATDRDGVMLRAGVSLWGEIYDGWYAGPYVMVSDYDTEGTDYENRAFEGAFTIASPSIEGYRARFTVGMSVADYAIDHSLNGFTEPREDDRIFARAAITLAFL